MVIKKYTEAWLALIVTLNSAVHPAESFSFGNDSILSEEPTHFLEWATAKPAIATPSADDPTFPGLAPLPTMDSTRQLVEQCEAAVHAPQKKRSYNKSKTNAFFAKLKLQLACPIAGCKHGPAHPHSSFASLCNHHSSTHGARFNCEQTLCKCPCCPGLQLIGKTDLFSHIKTHTEEELTAAHAFKEKTAPKELTRHEQLLREKGIVFRCTLCPSTFAPIRSLHRHYKELHKSANLTPSIGQYRCNPCNETFSGCHLDSLMGHIYAYHKNDVFSGIITTHFNLIPTSEAPKKRIKTRR